MDFLREYAVNIVTVSVLAVIFEIIMPSKIYKKYISVIIGFIVMMVIISPVKGIFGSDFETFTIDSGAETQNEFSENTNLLVSKEFKRRLEEEIEKEIKKTFNKETDCKVKLSVNEKGEIIEIDKVLINPYDLEIVNLVNSVFGIEKDKIGGTSLGGD